MVSDSQIFGGKWTREKLKILRNYLDSYTTALKRKDFNLIYIDAFAGSGSIKLKSSENPNQLDVFDDNAGRVLDTEGELANDPSESEVRAFLEGSAIIAARIKDKPFDELVFVETNSEARHKLQKKLKPDFDTNRAKVVAEDANEFLLNLNRDWRRHRGVLFLDPFGTQVSFKTLERVASFNALDSWILFPVGAVARLMERQFHANNSSIRHADRLTTIFGNECWKGLYTKDNRMSIWDDQKLTRQPGHGAIIELYKSRLKTLFGARLLNKTRPLMTSKNSRIFEFIFCAGNPKGRKIAHRIAGHIIDNA